MLIRFNAYQTPSIDIFSWEQANHVAQNIWKAKFSDLEYEIQFDDGESITGSIDLEPETHFAPYKETLFTTHLKTFWSNCIAHSKTGKFPQIPPEEADFFSTRLTFLPTDTKKIY